MVRLRMFAALCALALAACGPRGCHRAKQADPVARGDALLDAGKPLAAAVAYNEALKAGSSPRAQRGLGIALALLRRWDEAHAHLAKYVPGNADDAPARLALIATLAGRGDLVEARAQAVALADHKPELLGAQLLAAALANGAAEQRAALGRLERWQKRTGAASGHAKLPPAELWIARGTLLLALSDAAAAQAAFDQAAKSKLGDVRDGGFLAETYARTGQPAAAERLLRAATAQAPNLAPALRLLAEVELELDRPEQALAALDALSGDPLPVDGLLRARAELATGQSAQAIGRLRELLPQLDRAKQTGLAARARIALGRALIAADQIEPARQTLDAVEDPRVALDARMALAELELARKQPDAAVAALEKLSAEQPDFTPARLLLATAYLQARAPDKAEQRMTAYVQAHPDDARGHHLLGTVLEAGGRRDDARKAYERAIAIAPGSPAIVSLLGLLGTDHESAERLLREQIAAAPRIGALHRLLGERLERRGELATAEIAYKNAVDADGQRDSAWLALGEFYGRTKRPARALEMFEYVLRRAPDDPAALGRAAQVQARMGRTPEAVARYEQALQTRPNDLVVQNNLALLLAADPAQRDRALELAKAARAQAPDAPLVADTLGWVHLQRGETAQALALLEQSAAQLPDNAEAQHHLGMALLAADKQEAGRRAVQRGLTLDPDHPGAAEARAALAQP